MNLPGLLPMTSLLLIALVWGCGDKDPTDSGHTPDTGGTTGDGGSEDTSASDTGGDTAGGDTAGGDTAGGDTAGGDTGVTGDTDTGGDTDSGGGSTADADGDGYDDDALGGDDCDDTDPTIHPGAPELPDGMDRDCDGVADTMTLSAALAVLDGDSTGAPGDAGALGTGDFDGDGALDLAAASGEEGGWYQGRGWWVASRTWHDSTVPTVNSVAEASVSDGVYWASLGQVAPQAGDLDGDGGVDFAVGGSDGYWSSSGLPAVGVFFTAPSGSVGSDDGDVLVYGFEASAPAVMMLRSDLDPDGDGVAELLVACAQGDKGGDSSGWTYPGGMALASVDGRTGSFSVDDAEVRLTGTDSAALGTALGGGDLDGDGYDDMVLGAAADGTGGADAGAIFVLSGAADGSGSGEIDDAAAIELTGDAGSGLGSGRRSLVADVDADGSADLVVAAPEIGTVYVLSAAGSDTGVLAVSSAADATITSSAGLGYLGLDMAAADVDGDGSVELFLGAPESDQDRGSAGDGPGVLYVLDATMISGTVDAESGAVISGETDRDALGSALAVGDMDSDGTDEVLVAATGFDNTGPGRVYLLDFGE